MTTPAKNRSDTERRLISALVLLLAAGLLLALPFVLSAGSEFFLPLTAGLVLSIILSPLADLLRRTGLSNPLACLGAVLVLPVAFILGVSLILQPSLDLLARAPRLARRVAAHLEELRGGFSALSQVAEQLAAISGDAERTQVVLAAPSMVQQLAFATPSVVFEVALVLLFTFFLLEARFRLRRKLLLERSDFDASLRAARVLRDVQEQVGAYIVTAAAISGAVGVFVGLGAWAFGFETPIMWGGIAALLNLLPYFGPLAMTLLLAAFGLGTEPSLLAGLAPAACYLALHFTEANLVTPLILGKRLTLSPVAILASISYFSWVWGVAGIFLSVPILVILVALINHLGRPNIIGFLLGEPLIADRPGPPEQTGAIASPGQPPTA